MVYDVNSRTLILNDEGRAALSSRTGLIENDDGSVTMHFSPELKDGVEKNQLDSDQSQGELVLLSALLRTDSGLFRSDLSLAGHHACEQTIA